ncbi:MAG TPA: sigma-70 family RNA polymerase sigma factor [Acetobacteraceae bacterium]|nr:sigma-70 family RNA polymerase sigma factor [Acetobacteraceae bacterium]
MVLLAGGCFCFSEFADRYQRSRRYQCPSALFHRQESNGVATCGDRIPGFGAVRTGQLDKRPVKLPLLLYGKPLTRKELSTWNATDLPPISAAICRGTFTKSIDFLYLAPTWSGLYAVAGATHHDTSAAQQLVGSHLRLVVKIAMGYRGYGLPPEDLIAEGHVGLMRALCRFDPDHGVRFATCAIWWVRAAVQEFILRNWSLVKMGTTASQKKLFFNSRRMRRQLHECDDGTLTISAPCSRSITAISYCLGSMISWRRPRPSICPHTWSARASLR